MPLDQSVGKGSSLCLCENSLCLCGEITLENIHHRVTEIVFPTDCLRQNPKFSGKTKVTSINQIRVDVANENTQSPGSEVVFVGPTAEELSRATFAKLHDLRTHAQELRNRFARLLNRGSSLE